MTYGEFHLRLNLPLLALTGASSLLAPWPSSIWATFSAICLLAVTFTTPWDNYAVFRGIWGFPEGKYAFRIGYLPVEEYGFFILQTMEVLLLCHGLTGLRGLRPAPTPPLRSAGVIAGLAVLLAAWILAGLWARHNLPRRARYLFHLAYWFGPVLALQWVLAAPLLVANLLLIVLPAVTVGTWLTLADLVAVRHGIWTFDEQQILGVKWRGELPVEEILFFFSTSALVAQSYVVLAPAAARPFVHA